MPQINLNAIAGNPVVCPKMQLVMGWRIVRMPVMNSDGRDGKNFAGMEQSREGIKLKLGLMAKRPHGDQDFVPKKGHGIVHWNWDKFAW